MKARKKVKKWKHYIFEFIILFVAVTAGFLVDNFRENLADANREKEYIRLLISDLKSDSVKLTAFKHHLEYREAYLDTLLTQFNAENLKRDPQQLHFYALNVAILISPVGIESTDEAFKLLENDGFRVIHNRSLIDSVFLYYKGVNRINIHFDILQESNREMLKTMMEIFDFKEFNDLWDPLDLRGFDWSTRMPRIISHDSKLDDYFINQLADQKRRTLRTRHHAERLSKRASRHIAFLEDELKSLN